MTIYDAFFSPWRQPLLTALFLPLTAQIALIFAAFRNGRVRRVKGINILLFAVGAAVFFLALGLIGEDYIDPKDIAIYPVLFAFSSLPARRLAEFDLLAAVFTGFALWDGVRYRKRHLTRDSVKETMDLLPVGVAYGTPDGTVLFRNLVMDRLSYSLTGKALTDLNAFRAAVGEGEMTQVKADGKVWQVTAWQTEGGPEPLIQITAMDMTAQAGITAQLESKNKKLKDLRLRLEIYNKQAAQIIIAQEMLTARMTVHNELGQVLLESRHYMADPASINPALLLQALKNANTYLLREYEQDDTARDPLADAAEMAETIGVEVTFTGVIPANEPFRGVLAAAIRECATNTVKHAEGDALTVRVEREEGWYRYTLESNGAPPSEPVRELGGLHSLRQLVESKGGDMRIESAPAFRLDLALPDRAQE